MCFPHSDDSDPVCGQVLDLCHTSFAMIIVLDNGSSLGALLSSDISFALISVLDTGSSSEALPSSGIDMQCRMHSFLIRQKKKNEQKYP